MKTLNLLLVLPTLLLLTSCSAQIKNARALSVGINGECDMCKATIEKAGSMKREAEVIWDTDAKTAVVTYDSTRTTLDAVLQRVAQAGYDNQAYRAPDPAYASLPGCCQYERAKPRSTSEEANQRPAHANHIAPADAPAPVPTTTQDAVDPIKPVFTHYFALKNALVASDGAKAKEHAEALDGAMHSVDAAKLPADQQAMWTEVMKATMPSLHPLSESTDLEKQRVLFAKLAAPMAQLAKAVPQEAPIYVDHCPMYNGGADWLSLEKGIKNPYYGSMMMTCGSVQETIAK